MTSEQIKELKAAAERLKSHQMCVKDCNHLWNAHRQCQWCHSMQRDVDIGVVANHATALLTEIDELECTLSDEEAAHQGTLRMLEIERTRLADLERLREAVEAYLSCDCLKDLSAPYGNMQEALAKLAITT